MRPSDDHTDSDTQHVSPQFHELDPEDLKTEREHQEEAELEAARAQREEKKGISVRGVGLIMLTAVLILVAGIGVWAVSTRYSSSTIEVSLKGSQEQNTAPLTCPVSVQDQLTKRKPEISQQELKKKEKALTRLREELQTLKQQIEQVEDREKRKSLVTTYNTKRDTFIERRKKLETTQKRYNTQVQAYNDFLAKHCSRSQQGRTKT